MLMNKYIFIIFLILFVYELLVAILRKVKRRVLFSLAQKRSIATNKPLLVIGDPYNGVISILTGSDCGCGDVCLDLTGCPRCPTSLKGSLEYYLPLIDLSKYVVYISCVLEYVDDIDLILSYLRVMDFNDLFIVNVEVYSLAAYMYPYYLTGERPPKNILTKCPPWNDEITYIHNPVLLHF